MAADERMNLYDAETRDLYEREIRTDRRSSLSILLDLIADGSEVLDVGIGAGDLGRLLSRERGCRVDGSTLSAQEAAHAAAFYRRLEVADLSTVSLDALFAGRRYGAIVCADVLEHLPRPTAVLDACRRLLADDGRLLLSIPNVGYAGLIAELLAGEFRYRAEGLLDRSHVRFFTRRSLLRLLAEQGWRVDSVTEVLLDLPDSEFRPAFERLPPAVRRYLLAMPDGLAYQFVVQARPAASAEAAADALDSAPEPPPAATYSLQLYLKDPTGYAEDRKCTAAARIGEHRQTVRFVLPDAGGALTGLRFDPADRPGFLHLYALRLLDGRGAIVWQWDGAAESLQAGETHEVSLRTPWTTGPGVVLLLAGDDPYFELPITAGQLAACGAGAVLEVELAWPMSADYLLFVDDPAERGARERALRRELQQSRAGEQQAAERLTRLATELAAADARAAQQAAESARANERLAELDAAGRAAERERAALAAAHQAAEGGRRRARQEIASLTYALERRQADGAAALAERDDLARRLGDVQSSRWYRFGAWLARRIGRTRSPLLQPAAAQRQDDPPRALRPPRAGITIVVPVYRGLAETRNCLESVLRGALPAPLHIVVVNDASPEPELVAYLRRLAQRDKRVELIENTANLGFVASVNRGMQRHPDDDVILLNSDTEVAGDWIERLRAAAYRERGVATVTPFSNAATICSYPRFCVEGPLPADLSTAALDRYFAGEHRGRTVELPTAVGFCMFIRRDCLDEVGLFDADRFGRGYGEENDFCMRARAAGWRHVLALDTFVGHAGGVSFAGEKAARVQQAQDLLATLHPEYRALVEQHLKEDPARVARLQVDLARIRASGLPSLLFVSHVGGGGTERHLRELAALLATQANVFLLRPAAQDGDTVLEWLREAEGFELAFRLPAQFDALLEAARALGVAHLHFHHLRGHCAAVLELPRRLGVTHDFTVHDYYTACPQVTLSDEIGRYCSELGAEQCRACLARRPAPDGSTIEDWRQQSRQLLEAARHVYAPSEDASTRLRRYFPALPVQFVPHPEADRSAGDPAPRPIAGARPLRVVVIGALSKIKGADLVEAAAVLARQRSSRLDFHLLGYGYRPLRCAPDARLTVHGPYAERDLPGLLRSIDADVAWFPALWPETYSYTLSAALHARLPIVAADLGALPERLAGRPWSWICPWYWLSEEWLQFFESLLRDHFDPGQGPTPLPARATNPAPFSYVDDYLRDVRAAGPPPRLSAEFLATYRRGGDGSRDAR